MRLTSLAFSSLLAIAVATGCPSTVAPPTPDDLGSRDDLPPANDDPLDPADPADPEPEPPEEPVDPVDPDGPPAPDKCGNNVKDPGETCDGVELAQTTCAMLGFNGGSLRCGADCTAFDTGACTTPPPPPLGAPSPIAAPGASIAFNGSLDLTDPSWTRPAQDCAPSDSPGRRFELHRVVNNTGSAQVLGVLAAFGGDGFLHAYTGTFDAATPDVGCVAGDDDAAGGTTQSELVELAIAPAQVLTLVISTFGADAALGAYSVTVTTIGDDTTPPPSAVCGDGVVAGAEVCDGAALGGDTCGGHGFNRGALTCAAGCAAVDTATCWSIANPIAIAARGSAVTLSGALAMTDAKWRRPTEGCATAGALADRFFDAAQIVNNTGAAQIIDLTAAFAGDGFLHVFTAGFDPASPTAECVRGDDDFNGSAASQLTGIEIAAGHTLVVVASTFSANVALGAWSVEVRTTQPAVCGNGVIEGNESCDGATFGGQTCLGRGFDGGSLSCNAACSAVVESQCFDLAAPVAIAAAGGSIAFDGALNAADPRMDRVSEACTGSGAADHPWDGFRIINNGTAARTVTVTASWDGDGFLHAYRSAGFDPATPLGGCVRGDDDFGVAGSQLLNLPIAAGETLVIVASTFAGNANIGAYDIEVATDAPPATPIGAKGLTIQLSGSLDSTDANYERLSESCAATGASRKFDAFRIQNTSSAAQTLTIHGNWSGDGFLHVFGAGFDAANPAASCRRGDDDFGTNASRLTGVAVAAGETVVVVASTFSSAATLGTYTIDVLSEGDAAIAVPGASIATAGALHASDPLWNRPSESCTDDAGAATNFFDVHTIKNTTASAREIDVTATWTGGDGFLAVYFGDFDPAAGASAQCLDGDDDNGSVTSSRVEAITIFPNEVLTIVATSFAPSTPIGRYVLEVATQP